MKHNQLLRQSIKDALWKKNRIPTAMSLLRNETRVAETEVLKGGRNNTQVWKKVIFFDEFIPVVYGIC